MMMIMLVVVVVVMTMIWILTGLEKVLERIYKFQPQTVQVILN
jgi:predicted MFS family arabinose efflux permease